MRAATAALYQGLAYPDDWQQILVATCARLMMNEINHETLSSVLLMMAMLVCRSTRFYDITDAPGSICWYVLKVLIRLGYIYGGRPACRFLADRHNPSGSMSPTDLKRGRSSFATPTTLSEVVHEGRRKNRRRNSRRDVSKITSPSACSACGGRKKPRPKYGAGFV